MKLVGIVKSRFFIVVLMLAALAGVGTKIVHADLSSWGKDTPEKKMKQINQKIKDMDTAIDNVVINKKVNVQLPAADVISKLFGDLNGLIVAETNQGKLQQLKEMYKTEVMLPVQALNNKINRLQDVTTFSGLQGLIKTYEANFAKVTDGSGRPFNYLYIYQTIGFDSEHEGIDASWEEVEDTLKSHKKELLDAAQGDEAAYDKIAFRFRQIEWVLRDAISKKIYDLILQNQKNLAKVVTTLFPTKQVKDKFNEFFNQIFVEQTYIQIPKAEVEATINDKINK